jgi:hypothetical protein
MVWRGKWNTGKIEIRIEKQGCRQCEKFCQGWLIDENSVGFAVDCICRWILEDFYGVRNDDENKDQDEADKNEENTGPHDSQRCEARAKGTCKKCNAMKPPQTPRST